MTDQDQNPHDEKIFDSLESSVQESLKTEASEWLPEVTQESAANASSEAELVEEVVEQIIASEEKAHLETPVSIKPAEVTLNAASTFIADPFGLTALDVRDAQMEEDELDLETPSDEQVEAEIEAEIQAEAAPEAESAETIESTDVAEAVPAEAIEATETAEAAKAAADEDEALLEDGVPEQDPVQVEQEMSNLAAAIQKQEEAHHAELVQIQEAAQGESPEALLARQIAEDEALEKALALENEAAAEIDPELQAALPKQPVEDSDGNLDLAEMESCIESLLFMTDKPMSLEKLQGLLGPEISHALFQEAMTRLKDRYQKAHHGIEIVEVAGGFQFRTKVGRAALAKKLAKVQTQRLSAGAMETLAIVAYQQPVLKEDVDKIRGVDSSHFIRGLMEKKLIKISGRSDLPGRPMVYATTSEFLEVFGLKELSELPSLRELEQMIPASQSGEEDPRILEMRKLVQGMKSDTSVQLIYDAREDEKFLKDIRERVQSIPTSTPYLDQQKAAEKAAAEAAALGAEAPAVVVPGLEGLTAQATEVPAAIAPTET
ncbi:MAG: SMC-Scp complex subunit ScpB [Bdellovibrionales bacterium]|nr:SMC-Scp complex subunit ScpB [Bdellovibrionales bacterium]